MVKSHSSTPHDSAFKGFMSKIENARDFFDIHLPMHIKQLCNFDTLVSPILHLLISNFALGYQMFYTLWKHYKAKAIFIC